jgi:hypothetical protein
MLVCQRDGKPSAPAIGRGGWCIGHGACRAARWGGAAWSFKRTATDGPVAGDESGRQAGAIPSESVGPSALRILRC